MPQKCTHNPFDFLWLMPKGTDLRTGKTVFMRTLDECPLYATDGSEFCMPHSILHGDNKTPEIRSRQMTYVIKCVNFTAHGLLIEPPKPDGTLVYPGWWMFRHN